MPILCYSSVYFLQNIAGTTFLSINMHKQRVVGELNFRRLGAFKGITASHA